MTVSRKVKSASFLLASVVAGAALWAPSAVAEYSRYGYTYESKCPNYDQDPFHECHNEEKQKKKKKKKPSTFPPAAGPAPFDPFRTEGGGNGGSGGGGGGGGGTGRG